MDIAGRVCSPNCLPLSVIADADVAYPWHVGNLLGNLLFGAALVLAALAAAALHRAMGKGCLPARWLPRCCKGVLCLERCWLAARGPSRWIPSLWKHWWVGVSLTVWVLASVRSRRHCPRLSGSSLWILAV